MQTNDSAPTARKSPEPTVVRMCETCASPFKVWAAKVIAGRGRFCSKRCHDIAQTPSLMSRLLARVVTLDNGCWQWTGNLLWSGYGYLTLRNKKISTHRASWIARTGTIPTRADFVLHTCDAAYAPGDTSYRACIRNDEEGTYELGGKTYRRFGHLYLADHAANMLDRTLKGRGSQGLRHGSVTHPEALPRGESNTSAALTDDAVRQIRAMYDAGGVSQVAIATHFNINQTTISRVVLRKTWRHVI